MPEVDGKTKRKLSLVFKGGGKAEEFLLDMVEEVEKKLDDHIEAMDVAMTGMEERMENRHEKVMEAMPNLATVAESIRGATGEKGEKGDLPTKDEIIEVVVPLIPDPVPGEKGERGERGEKGEKGDRGDPGESIIGLPGKDANPEEVLELVEKRIPELGERIRDSLELLKDEDRLDVSAIKGLSDELKRLNDNVGATRAALGAVRQMRISEFSFQGDDSTTGFSLPKEPHAKGKAIWVSYNGQLLQPTAHYTISGKTLNLTFTPATGSNVEGFLINY